MRVGRLESNEARRCTCGGLLRLVCDLSTADVERCSLNPKKWPNQELCPCWGSCSAGEGCDLRFKGCLSVPSSSSGEYSDGSIPCRSCPVIASAERLPFNYHRARWQMKSPHTYSLTPPPPGGGGAVAPRRPQCSSQLILRKRRGPTTRTLKQQTWVDGHSQYYLEANPSAWFARHLSQSPPEILNGVGMPQAAYIQDCKHQHSMGSLLWIRGHLPTFNMSRSSCGPELDGMSSNGLPIRDFRALA